MSVGVQPPYGADGGYKWEGISKNIGAQKLQLGGVVAFDHANSDTFDLGAENSAFSVVRRVTVADALTSGPFGIVTALGAKKGVENDYCRVLVQGYVSFALVGSVAASPASLATMDFLYLQGNQFFLQGDTDATTLNTAVARLWHGAVTDLVQVVPQALGVWFNGFGLPNLELAT